jgi:GTPase-associated protein 1, N-terminal domain type 2
MVMIHQVYCTHCTFGTAAFERREGPLASRVFGYSARAGSLAAEELRKRYRLIERFVYYYLPSDTPPEKKVQWTAADAPRRLVYSPSAGGLQLLGQICYRQKDAANQSAGCYFGHVLFSETGDSGTGWSLLDCLQAWGSSRWVVEDAPSLPFDLEPLSSLDEIRDEPPAINDRLLLSFLTTPTGQTFDDVGCVIPERWREKSPEERQQLMTTVLGAYAATGGNRRESLLLVAEPSLAALLFYGVVRLLPAGKITQELSFSTFEPSPQRLCTSMAATVFHDPRACDLPADAYRRGFALNTFSNRQSEERNPSARYARTVVDLLADAGWEEVDRALEGFQAVNPGLENLEDLVSARQRISVILDPHRDDAGDWRGSQIATHYLRHAIARHFAALPSPLAHHLGYLIGTPAHLRVLEILAGTPEMPGVREVKRHLLSKLPSGQVAHFMTLKDIGAADKVPVLVNYLSLHYAFPPGWEELADRGLSRGPGMQERILPQVLANLSNASIKKLFCKAKPLSQIVFLQNLFEACNFDSSKQEVLESITSELDEDVLLDFLDVYAPELSKRCPDVLPSLEPRLTAILDELPTRRDPDEFDRRLDVLTAAKGDLSGAAAGRIDAWQRFQRTLLEMRELQSVKPSLWSRYFQHADIERYDVEAQRLAEYFQRGCGDRDSELLPVAQRAGVMLTLAANHLQVDGHVFSGPIRSKLIKYFHLGSWDRDRPARKRVAMPRFRLGFLLVSLFVVLPSIVFSLIWKLGPSAETTRSAVAQLDLSSEPAQSGAAEQSQEANGGNQMPQASAKSEKDAGEQTNKAAVPASNNGEAPDSPNPAPNPDAPPNKEPLPKQPKQILELAVALPGPVRPGSSTSCMITIQRTNCRGDVTVKFEPPKGVTISPITIAAKDIQGEFQIDVGKDAEPRDWVIPVVATCSGAIAHTTTMNLAIVRPRLTLNVISSPAVEAGETATWKVKVVREWFEDPVTLNFDALPDGIKIPQTIISTGKDDVEIPVKAADSAVAVEDRRIKVIARSSRTEEVRLECKLTVKAKDPRETDAIEAGWRSCLLLVLTYPDSKAAQTAAMVLKELEQFSKNSKALDEERTRRLRIEKEWMNYSAEKVGEAKTILKYLNASDWKALADMPRKSQRINYNRDAWDYANGLRDDFAKKFRGTRAFAVMEQLRPAEPK